MFFVQKQKQKRTKREQNGNKMTSKFLSQNVHVLSYFTFGKGLRPLSIKHEIRCFLISGTSNRATMGDFPSNISANGP